MALVGHSGQHANVKSLNLFYINNKSAVFFYICSQLATHGKDSILVIINKRYLKFFHCLIDIAQLRICEY
jgi:hypothetical protein